MAAAVAEACSGLIKNGGPRWKKTGENGRRLKSTEEEEEEETEEKRRNIYRTSY